MKRQIAVAGMAARSIEFGSFTLDLDRLCLWGPSGQVDLRPKSFEEVRYLAQHAGRVVTKDEAHEGRLARRDTVREILLLRIARHVRARKDRD